MARYTISEISDLMEKIKKAHLLANVNPMLSVTTGFYSEMTIDDLFDTYERLKFIVNRNITIRMVLLSGSDEAIDAAGINVYCINEGLATGDEFIHLE